MAGLIFMAWFFGAMTLSEAKEICEPAPVSVDCAKEALRPVEAEYVFND